MERKFEPGVHDVRVESKDPTDAKREHREEAQERYLAKPLSERLLIAISMVGPKSRGTPGR